MSTTDLNWIANYIWGIADDVREAAASLPEVDSLVAEEPPDDTPDTDTSTGSPHTTP